MKKSTCEFCLDKPNGIKPIFESAHFYVTPSLGQIVPGYLLICTQQHFISLSQIPQDYFSDLKEVQERVRRVLIQEYYSPIFYEHGPVKERQGVCCVDHAHLHCVPLGKDLLEDITQFLAPTEIQDISELMRQQEKGIPYLYYESSLKMKYVVELHAPILSQFMRQLAAISVGKPESWDWRIHPTKETCEEVAENLRGRL